jgi:hypothetical protein
VTPQCDVRRVCDLVRLIVRKFLDNAMQILQIRYNYFNEAKYFKESERKTFSAIHCTSICVMKIYVIERGSTQIVWMLEYVFLCAEDRDLAGCFELLFVASAEKYFKMEHFTHVSAIYHAYAPRVKTAI